MKKLKNCILEAYNSNPKDITADYTAGITDNDELGIICGKPFKHTDKKAIKEAYKLANAYCTLDGYDINDVVEEMEQFGDNPDKYLYCYFISVEGGPSFACYVFGDYGVQAVK
jgi:uncharacterized Rmd1/YagE family protein